MADKELLNYLMSSNMNSGQFPRTARNQVTGSSTEDRSHIANVLRGQQRPDLPTESLQTLGSSSVYRRLTMKPTMCGNSSMFVAQVGDWTWDTVTALCGTDVLTARNMSGAPTYLAFYYIHIKSGPRLNPLTLTFGDELEAVSTAFNLGSESIFTLHRITRYGANSTIRPVEIDEVHENPHPEALYVETFNRWVCRSQAHSNEDLIRSSPAAFEYSHLCSLPDEYSPRLICGYARANNSFHPSESAEYVSATDDFTVEYPVDAARDVNGVGLIYFASYYAIIDSALMKLWKHLGRSTQSFLARTLLDHRLCFLGNADIDSILKVKLRSWQKLGDPSHAVFDAVIQDSGTMRVIAVSTMHIRYEDA